MPRKKDESWKKNHDFFHVSSIYCWAQDNEKTPAGTTFFSVQIAAL
jgi:hypothetical protein